MSAQGKSIHDMTLAEFLSLPAGFALAAAGELIGNMCYEGFRERAAKAPEYPVMAYCNAMAYLRNKEEDAKQ